MHTAIGQRSIRWVILLPWIIIFVACLVEAAIVSNMNLMQRRDAVWIDLAGHQALLSQEICITSLKHMVTGDGGDAQAVAALINTFDQTEKVLREGGRIEIEGQTLTVAPPKKKQDIQLALKEIDDYWKKVRPLFAEVLQQPPVDPAYTASELQQATKNLVRQIEEVRHMYHNASMAVVNGVMLSVYGFAPGLLIMIFIVWRVTNKVLIAPVLELRDTACRIASGDLTRANIKPAAGQHVSTAYAAVTSHDAARRPAASNRCPRSN